MLILHREGPLAHAIKDTPGRGGPYKPKRAGSPWEADSQQLTTHKIPKPWMAVAARGTIEWMGCGSGIRRVQMAGSPLIQRQSLQ